MRCVALVAAGVVAIAISAPGCRRSPEMGAACAGDTVTLGRLIDAKQKAGSLTNRAAADLARVVADRDIRTALGRDAVELVEGVRPCARELDETLAARMRVHDAAGAVAALERVESGALREEEIHHFFAESDGSWRAVGARGLVRRDDRQARERALLDPNPEVRRQAVRAARQAKDMSDLAALAESGRSDPEPTVRTEAVRALGALPSPPGSRDVANALRDLWTSGDEELRRDIALAWSSPAQWHSGGREALQYVVDTARGLSAIQAAEAVLRHPDASADLTGEAVALLAEQMTVGSRAERIHALAVAPLQHAALLSAATAAARDDDLAIRIAGLARLAEGGGMIAVAELEALAQPGGAAANDARMALAMAGDRRVQLWLEQSLQSRSVPERLEAATALARLGVAARSAPLLVDTDPQVRVRAACEVLLAGKK
jgi:hypothetical protein